MRYPVNFPRHELLFSATAVKHRIDNEPKDAETEANLIYLANTLQFIRDTLSEKYGRNIAIVVSSGYRSTELNSKLSGSAANSAHLAGLGADLVPAKSSGLTVAQLYKDIASISGLLFDQLIIERVAGKEWVHFGLRRPDTFSVRNQVFAL